ncbi:hypothetical protein VCV18_005090 [Metarhizium anisopliae]
MASRIIDIASSSDGLFLARTLRKRKILKPGLASVPTALALLVQQYVTITETTLTWAHLAISKRPTTVRSSPSLASSAGTWHLTRVVDILT